MDNELLDDLEQLQLNINDERDYLHRTIDTRMNRLENEVLRLRKRMQADIDQMMVKQGGK